MAEQFEAPYRKLLREEAIPQDVQGTMILAANRARNMTSDGGRFSDLIRSEIAAYRRQGHDGYLVDQERASQLVRSMGY